jgi:ribulose-5-phosphate 4-epimerase/fuculose-1-phosphate aldolase
MSVHAITSRSLDPVQQAKIQLAAAHRLAVFHDLEQGIDNHFTVTVPGCDDQYLILPFGLHWSEARASDMIVFDESGKTLEGEGDVELSALCIHAPIHRISGVRVVLHTHQTWAVALNMLKDNRLVPASQTAAYFHSNICYDDDYAGNADTMEEGERLARLLGNKQIMFMKNHGVLVSATAYRRLIGGCICSSASAARRLLAMGTGRPLEIIPTKSSRRFSDRRRMTAIKASAIVCTSRQ